jgi:uncharacterized membrane protein
MSQLVVAVYADEEAADHVLGVLRAHPAELAGAVHSSATVRVGAEGSYTVTTDMRSADDAFWGVLWEALFGMVFLVPTAGTGYGANLGALFGAVDRAGLDGQFRAQLRAGFRRPSSGLAILATDWDGESILSGFVLRPLTLVTASLDLEPNSELMRELGGSPSRRMSNT